VRARADETRHLRATFSILFSDADLSPPRRRIAYLLLIVATLPYSRIACGKERAAYNVAQNGVYQITCAPGRSWLRRNLCHTSHRFSITYSVYARRKLNTTNSYVQDGTYFFDCQDFKRNLFRYLFIRY